MAVLLHRGRITMCGTMSETLASAGGEGVLVLPSSFVLTQSDSAHLQVTRILTVGPTTLAYGPASLSNLVRQWPRFEELAVAGGGGIQVRAVGLFDAYLLNFPVEDLDEYRSLIEEWGR